MSYCKTCGIFIPRQYSLCVDCGRQRGWIVDSCCVVCGKVITWRFSLCSDCEEEWGNYASDWPEWVRFLVNQSRRERRQAQRDSETLTPLLNENGFYYTVNYEDVVTYRTYITHYTTSDGEEVPLKDSDWEAVYEYGL